MWDGKKIKIQIPEHLVKRAVELNTREVEIRKKLEEVERKLKELDRKVFVYKTAIAEILDYYPNIDATKLEEYQALMQLKEEYENELKKIYTEKEKLAYEMIKELLKK